MGVPKNGIPNHIPIKKQNGRQMEICRGKTWKKKKFRFKLKLIIKTNILYKSKVIKYKKMRIKGKEYQKCFKCSL